MMNESIFWQNLKALFATSDGLIDRVENRLAPAFPDTVYSLGDVHGFIELKYLREWPHAGRINMVRCFGDQFPRQVMWLVRHGARGGGHCFVFLHVERPLCEWYLFDRHSLCRFEPDMLREDFCALALGAWFDHLHWPALAFHLTGADRPFPR